MRLRSGSRALVAVLTAAAGALANEPERAGAAPPVVTKIVDAPCANLRGFVTDVDPKGTNLRSGPSDDARVVTRIPPPVHIQENQSSETVSATLAVIGSHDGWLLVRDVSLGEGGPPAGGGASPAPGAPPAGGGASPAPGARERYAWSGPGWISGDLVGFAVGSRVLHASPSTKSPVRESLVGSGYGPDSFEVSRTFACRGRWAEVELTSANPKSTEPVRGWVGAVCDTQLTTCDNVDLP